MICFLVVWAIASIAWAVDSAATREAVPRLVVSMLLCPIAVFATRSTRDAFIILGGLAAGGILSVLIGLGSETSAGRFVGATGDPNELGALLLPGVAFGLAMAETREMRPLARAGGALIAATLLIGVAATASRGAIVGLAALMIVVLSARAAGPRSRVVSAGLVAVVPVLFLATSMGAGLVEHVTTYDDGGTGRRDLWATSASVVRDYPLTGVGPGGFPAVAPTYGRTISVDRRDIVIYNPSVVHNTPLQFAVDLGIPGALALLVIVLGALISIRSCIGRQSNPIDFVTFVATRNALVALAVALLFISGQFEKQFWILLGVALALGTGERDRA